MSHTRQSATALTRDGITLRYVMHGSESADRPRLALVHSLGMTGHVWDDLAERLAGEVTVLTYDCRGHGASTRAAGPYSVDMFARDLVDLLDAVGWNSAHLAGASMGGNVSLHTAILFPDRVRTLGLVDTTAWYGADAPQRWEERARNVEEKGLEPLVEFQESRWFSDRFRAQKPAPIARCRELLLANDRASYAASCRMLGAFDLREGLAGLRVPTAIVVGEEDYATPVAMARQLEAGIPGATLQILPGLRHLTFVERPDIVAAALLALMNRAASSVQSLGGS